MTDIQLKHALGTITKSGNIACTQNRIIDLKSKNMIGMTLLVTNGPTIHKDSFSIWVDYTENITSGLTITSQVSDTTYSLNQGTI